MLKHAGFQPNDEQKGDFNFVGGQLRQFSATKKTTGNKKKAKTGATAKRKTKTKEEKKIPHIQLEKQHDESSEYEGKPLI